MNYQEITDELTLQHHNIGHKVKHILAHNEKLQNIHNLVKTFSTSEDKSVKDKIYKFGYNILYPIMNPHRNISTKGTGCGVGKWFGRLHNVNIQYFDCSSSLFNNLQQEHIDLMPAKKRQIGQDLFDVIKACGGNYKTEVKVDIPVQLIHVESFRSHNTTYYIETEPLNDKVVAIGVGIEDFFRTLTIHISFHKVAKQGNYIYTNVLDNVWVRPTGIVNGLSHIYENTYGGSSTVTIENLNDALIDPVTGYINRCLSSFKDIHKKMADFQNKYSYLLLEKGKI